MANGTSGRLDYIIQRGDQAESQGYQLEQAAAQRDMQERMQQKALRQNAIFGGINAAINVGQLGLGVANYMQRSDQIAQQREDSQVSELLAGGLAASKVAGDVMDIRRRKDQFDLSVTRGNERMLQNVSNDADKIILDRINQNDPEALDEGLRKKLVTYPRHVESELRSVNARIAQIQVDDSYSPQARDRAIAVLSNKQAALRWQVEPNPGKPMSASELAQTQVGVIADPTNPQRQIRVVHDRSGALKVFETDAEKDERTHNYKMQQVEQEARIKSMYGGDSGSSGGGSKGGSRAIKAAEIDQEISQAKLRITAERESELTPIVKAELEAAAKASAGKTILGGDKEPAAVTDAMVTAEVNKRISEFPEPSEDELFKRLVINRRLALRLEAYEQQVRENPQLLNEPIRKPAFWPQQKQEYPPIRPVEQPGSIQRLPPVNPNAPQAPLPPQIPGAYPNTGEQAPAAPESGPKLTPPAGQPAIATDQPTVTPQRAKQIVKAIPVNVRQHLPTPKSQEERDRLPRGTLYLGPDGTVRRKG